jgi:hypothetical protein
VQLLQHVPCIAVIGALLFLGWGLLRRSLDITLASLTAVVLTGVIAIPIFASGPRTGASTAAVVALEATAGVALAALFVWRTTRRYPLFPAAAVLLIGVAASILVVRAAM